MNFAEKSTFLLILCGLSFSVAGFSQEADSLKAGGDRGVMLNAESASMPREISIGLPTGDNGAAICEDGVKHSYSFVKGHYHWAGGNAYSSVGLRGLSESVIRTGDIGMVVDSYTKLGVENHAGVFSFKSSTFGLINFDGSVSGPIKKGWHYSLGVYVNLNPTSVNAPGRTFVDNKQIFKAALSRRWENASFDIIYKLSFSKDNLGGYGEAPFYYNGDGSISEIEGYKLGRSCYFPANDDITYMDLNTGDIKTGDIGKMDDRQIHDILFKGKYKTDSGWDLTGFLHGCVAPKNNWVKSVVSGIDVSTDGFLKNGKAASLEDGSTYSGKLQNRVVSIIDSKSLDVTALFEANKVWAKHDLNLGAEIYYVGQYEKTASARIAHTVTADPQRIYLDGQSSWGYNMNSQYAEGFRWSATAYAFDDWKITDRFLLRAGLRLRPLYQSIDGASVIDEATAGNKKTEGFYLNNGVAKKSNVTLRKLDYAGTLYATYRLVDGLFFMGEGFYSITNKSVSYFKATKIPTLKAIGNAMGRGGLMYENEWMDATAMMSYITSWNNAATVSVTKQIGGVSETQDYTAQYGIGTLGFNFDGNMHWGGFNLHLMFTFQDPKYKNYDNVFTFSDGSTSEISYTGNYVTGISRVMLEIDPSYSYKDWRFWASARYFSRQYASRTNLAYFKGRWETFGGIDYKITSDLKLSLNVVNWLFQRGPKGSIDVADTISDASELEGYLMSGKYMRPFEVNIGVTYKF